MKYINIKSPIIALTLIVGVAYGEFPEKLIEVRREKDGNSLVGAWRTNSESYRLSYSKSHGVKFSASGVDIPISNGPLVASEAIISKEENALLIVLRAKNEKNEYQFRAFILVSDIADGSAGAIIVNYLDIMDYDWEPDFDSIVEFQESTRSVRLKKQAKEEGGEPTFQDVKLDNVQPRRRPDSDRMERKWKKLMKEARDAADS